MSASLSQSKASAGLTLAALGVVYGDIGTSPLYAFKQVFVAQQGIPIAMTEVLGILSLFLWSLLLVVALKYVLLIMRADNKGEGGIIALTTLAMHGLKDRSSLARLIVAMGLCGAAFFYGDGVITPAISVLSAVEGLTVITPIFAPWVIPVSLVILVGLFVFQRKGTASVGALFGPVMMVWFVVLALLGLKGIWMQPQVLAAINPIYGVEYLSRNPWTGFLSLGAVVLCITGAEALYADMGHFGRSPIRRSWTFFVFPALVLNYFGQGALVLANAQAIESPFFLLAPESMRYPLVILSTMATVIASQAVISGAFSLSKQAMNMGYTPRFDVHHTSEKEVGQIYVPAVNWLLLFIIVILVMAFQSSERLAAAYGIAVTGTMLITDVLALIVAIRHWHWKPWVALAVMLPLAIVDGSFYAANLFKVPDGGWFPLVFAAGVFLLFVTWKRGRDLVRVRLSDDTLDLKSFVTEMVDENMTRINGVAVFMTHESTLVPHSLLHSLKHYQSIHQQVFVVSLQWHDVPHIPTNHRYAVEYLGYGFHRVALQYGFKDDIDIPAALSHLPQPRVEVDWSQASYFLGRETLIPAVGSDMPYWQELVFISLYRMATSATNFFKLPTNRVVELGSQIVL